MLCRAPFATSIAVKFKAISGSEDRAAGLVWRAVDANNYYVVRANALEDNVVQVCGLTFCLYRALGFNLRAEHRV